MLKMTAKEIAEQKRLEAELREAHEAVEAAKKSFNDKVEEVREFLSTLYGRIEDEVSVRSEKWHESDKAARVSEWMEEIADSDPTELTIAPVTEVAEKFLSLSTAPMED